MGHHRYWLTGDPGIILRAYVTLDREYIPSNREAWAQRRDGVPPEEIRHVSIIEGGFPVLLLLAREMGDRAPFLVNAVLLPFLLLFIALCIALMDGRPHRREWAALAGLLLLLHFSTMAGRVWELALPFRDTLSHTLGFGALLVLWAGESLAKRRAAWVFWAGLLIGLSGWVRLPGYLFFVPAALVVLCTGTWGTFRRRVSFLLWLGAGLSLGVALLAAQNLFEGRHIAHVPQADSLFIRDAVDGEPGRIRRGWHPANLPMMMPRLRYQIWHVYPVWISVLCLVGVAGWIFQAGRKAFHLLPLIAGAAVFALFYGCYGAVVGRYSLIIVLFTTAIGALGAGWLLEALIRGLLHGRVAATRLLRAAMTILLAVGVGAAALRSGPNWSAASAEWEDAQRFASWTQTYLPGDGALLILSPGLLTWSLYFGGVQNQWTLTPRGAAATDPSTIVLPEQTPLWMSTLASYPDQDDRGWVLDALLNRYALDPLGPALRFQSLGHDGVRLYHVKERDARALAFDVAMESEAPDRLFLFMRDTRPSGTKQDVLLRHASWPRPWPVTLRPGANVLMMPRDLTTRPEGLEMQSDRPLPSLVEAAWHGAEPIRVHFSDYPKLPSRLQHLDRVALRWTGYRMWWRDFAAFSRRHQSIPWIYLRPDSRIRPPNLVGEDRHHGVLRLYYSAAADTQDELDVIHRLTYRQGERDLIPLTVLYNQTYSTDTYPHISDYMQELKWSFPGELYFDARALKLGEEGPALVLHGMEFLVEEKPAPMPQARDVPAVVGWSWREAPHDRWMKHGWSHQPWIGYGEKARLQEWAATLPENDVVLADGYYAGIWTAYGGGHPVSLHAVWNDGPDGCTRIARMISDWLAEGRAVHALDAAPPEGRQDGVLRLITRLYDIEGEAPFLRVIPWTTQHTRTTLPAPGEETFLLRADTRCLWRPGLSRTFARLVVDGEIVSDRLTNGFHYIHMRRNRSGDEMVVELESDGPLPAQLHAAVLPVDESIGMPVSPLAELPHTDLLDAPSRSMGEAPWTAVTVSGDWRVRVPAIWPADTYGVLAELRWRRDDAGETDSPVLVQVDGQTVAHVTYVEHGVHGAAWMIPAPSRDVFATLQWADPGRSGARPVELSALRLRSILRDVPRTITVGATDDEPFIGEGFFGRERYYDVIPFRWTSERSVLRLFEPSGTDSVRLRVTYFDARPKQARDARLNFRLNGQPLSGVDRGESEFPPFRVWEATVPPEEWGTGIHELEIQCNPWSPALVSDSRDGRLLGIMVHRVDLAPAP